ncbi:hypothetical protein LT493_18660 [Streptomyces tricolor]|nr:hypothetical protein [Streptomyces tricolor]
MAGAAGSEVSVCWSWTGAGPGAASRPGAASWAGAWSGRRDAGAGAWSARGAVEADARPSVETAWAAGAASTSVGAPSAVGPCLTGLRHRPVRRQPGLTRPRRRTVRHRPSRARPRRHQPGLPARADEPSATSPGVA